MRSTELKRLVKTARRPDESWLAMSKRLGIPYSTLRRLERGDLHESEVLAAHYLTKLGVARV